MTKQKALLQIAEEIKNCRRCPLGKKATRAVPGEGNSDAQVMFIGEAPGFWEDQRGIPFCGAAGKLLDKLLAKAGLRREEVFIANILKHRPPQNRDPKIEEIEACQVFLDRQIEIINPQVVVSLGRFSLGKFLPDVSITRAHGRPQLVNFGGKELILFPMYHPAAALRNGKIMEEEEKDFRRLGDFLRKINGEEGTTIKENEENSQGKKEEQLRLV
ncbi:uracil-DNA glycosylase [Candidatus Shapirobacteria bacterium]|nr:uracil-DNA glycosylase [Candidatus Shapirobacteria bacterium]